MYWLDVGETFRFTGMGGVEHLLAFADPLRGHAVAQHLRGQCGDAAVMMFLVLPGKGRLGEGT